MTTEQLAALKEVAEKAQQQAPEQRILMRYEHGGGRMYVERDDPDNDLRPHRDLVADFYDEASREHYAAFDPTTCLELLGEVERLNRFRIDAVQLCRDSAAKWQRDSNGYNERDGMAINLVAKAAAGREIATALEKLK